MSKRVLSIASGVLIAILVFSNVFAGTIKLSGVSFSLGSLISTGGLSGLGNTDVTLVLTASGIPGVTCTNGGGNQVPGQSTPKVTATGSTTLIPNSTLTKNGSTPYYVETTDSSLPTLTWQQGGCPNSNWSAAITFVYWTDAVITVYLASDTSFSNPILTQKYVCTTTFSPKSVSCTPK